VGIFDRIADQLGDLIVPDDVRMHVEMGAASLERGDLDLAVKELRRAIELRPDHHRAAYLLGLALARKGDLAGAEAALEGAVRERADFAEALVALGETRRRQGRTEAAAETFRKALEAGVADGALRGEACRGLGAAYLELGRLDRAVRELRKAVAQLPDDIESQGLLGRALAQRGDLDAARVCLERAAQSKALGGESGARALGALGEVYLQLGRPGDAEVSFARALTLDERLAGARLGLSRARLAAGDAAGAHGHALQALAENPRSAEAHLQVGRALARVRSWEPALAALDQALISAEGDARDRVLDEALHVALQADLPRRAAVYADRALAEAENNRTAPPQEALAAAALARLDEGDRAGAAALLARAEGREGPELLMARARVELAGNQPVAAAAILRRAIELAPDDARPRQRLAEVYRASRGEAPADLNALLRAAQKLAAAAPELGDLAPEAARLIDVLDRPLLVTVMGEFNAGKSSFVNALVGEDVAPTGITPTTATINLLKYGAERAGRVVYRDDTVRDVPWAEVPELLRGLDEAEARRIRLVEVLYPLETLQRVNVVDTPGLNSILPEHEEAARGFIAQADAIIWLFSCGQAGKASEREALEQIRGEKKKALGVLNKIDRVEDPKQLEEILAHLRGGFGELVETLVPFSAREALAGRGDPARLARSNKVELERVLEERFFARSKSIKREAAARRLRALLDEASARVEAELANGRAGEIERVVAAVRADRVLFERRFLGEERLRLVGELDELWTGCAREVLDFVRPRRWAFGSNQAAPADRDFLLGLVEEKLGVLGDRSRVRVVVESRRALDAVHAVSPDLALADDHLRLLGESVYGRHRAFARGYLRGGRVDDFFTRVLPKLDLDEPSLRRALERDMPSLDVADAELLAPLRAWSAHLFDDLLARLKRVGDAEELRRFEIEERLAHPLGAMREALERVEAPRG
jgi:tetratricopeptide (TPR) repeat protein